MKALKIILIGLVLLVIAFIVAGMMMPRGYEFERSITIKATPQQIHSHVGDLAKWEDWTPWKEEDPTVKVTLGPATTGKGASQIWTSKRGKASLEFTMSDPARGIEYDMTHAMGNEDDAEEAKSLCKMLYKPDGDSTIVTWSMKGDMPSGILGGYRAKMMNSMAGPMFERGLEKLKKNVEASE